MQYVVMLLVAPLVVLEGVLALVSVVYLCCGCKCWVQPGGFPQQLSPQLPDKEPVHGARLPGYQFAHYLTPCTVLALVVES